MRTNRRTNRRDKANSRFSNFANSAEKKGYDIQYFIKSLKLYIHINSINIVPASQNLHFKHKSFNFAGSRYCYYEEMRVFLILRQVLNKGLLALWTLSFS